jgi:hypothetical protein
MSTKTTFKRLARLILRGFYSTTDRLGAVLLGNARGNSLQVILL